MISTWIPAVPAILVATILIVLPGLLVITAGWRLTVSTALLSPAASMSIIAVAAIVAPILHIAWSWIAVLVFTALASGGAYLLRARHRVADRGDARSSRTMWLAAIVSLIGSALLLARQSFVAFVDPENISQTFDNIVHLNTVRFVLETGNASAFWIGQTSDISFYPNGWHALTALVAQLAGVSVPQAVNAANIAIAAVVWPSSASALAVRLLGERLQILTSAALLAAAFGAFPFLLLYFGVLYPNFAAYAVLPAAVAAAHQVIRGAPSCFEWRNVFLFVALAGGVGLCHPNAFLALIAVAVAWVIANAVEALITRSRRASIGWTTTAVVTVTMAALIWMRARTPYEMSRWESWQTPAQAFGEGLLLSPRQYPLTYLTIACVLVGLWTLARRASQRDVLIPMGVALFFFVLASGYTPNSTVREFFTNPWYNDSFRLAALLPVLGLPVAVAGADVLWRWMSGSRPWRQGVAGVLAVIALASTSFGANVSAVITETRATYTEDDSSALLSSDERALLERLDETTPTDAVILGSPRSGASLAYALADRSVTEYHIFGYRSADENYLIAHLRDIEDDPLVCAAVERTGVDYVLDFGAQDVHSDAAAAAEYEGIQDLSANDHLVLVDEEGPHARLFRIEGCDQ